MHTTVARGAGLTLVHGTKLTISAVLGHTAHTKTGNAFVLNCALVEVVAIVGVGNKVTARLLIWLVVGTGILVVTDDRSPWDAFALTALVTHSGRIAVCALRHRIDIHAPLISNTAVIGTHIVIVTGR